MNKQEIIFQRGLVIDAFVTIELMINTIISMHYLKTVDTGFVIDVLNNEMSSFGFKKTLLKQILDEKTYNSEFQKLEKLNRLRNLFGHASLKLQEGTNIADQNAKICFNDPKKSSSEVDPKTASKEFEKLFLEVLSWLQTVGTEKGINYPSTD